MVSDVPLFFKFHFKTKLGLTLLTGLTSAYKINAF